MQSTYLLKAEKLKLHECPFEEEVEGEREKCIECMFFSRKTCITPSGILHNLCNGGKFIPLGEILLTLDKGSWRMEP